ncbi:unnamed protein product [Caenorhabditis angaria]|uniref:Uncharacterized protein n=1 Tax=Caenorhabditis angaria TaxID=860376 RepID=A0A9P1INQ2_9PELO|nr:unnamed protein product [Caenorhabditis angaria]
MSTKSAKINELLNRKRKIQEEKVEEPSPSTSNPTPDPKPLEEKDEKTEKAKKALLFEAKRAKERSDSMGPQGWIRPKCLETNKRFLQNTLKSTLTRKERERLNGK